MPRPIEIAGQKFGMLLAVRALGISDGDRGRLWEFKCDCGGSKSAPAYRVKSGHIRSCGCATKGEAKAKGARTHGYSDTRTYSSWSGMISRCRNEKSSNYPH